jgi:hypothetical protein
MVSNRAASAAVSIESQDAECADVRAAKVLREVCVKTTDWDLSLGYRYNSLNDPGIQPIPDYPGYYARSDGAILRTVLVPLAQTPDKEGYATVMALKKNGTRPLAKHVHQLMMMAFHPSKPPDMETRHKDNDRMNPSLDNLHWGTSQDNADDRNSSGRTACGEKIHRAKLSDEKVRDIRRRYRNGEGQQSLAAAYKIDATVISRIVRRLAWKHVT